MSDDELRWGVYSYDDDRWYVSDPPDRQSAVANMEALRADGEACMLADEPLGQAMQNAANHARSKERTRAEADRDRLQGLVDAGCDRCGHGKTWRCAEAGGSRGE